MAEIIYQPLYEVITARFAEIAALSVVPALSTAKRVPPLADLWLAEDREIESQPAEIRELVFVAEVEVAHQEPAGDSQQQMHGLLDAVRAQFRAWRPADCKGLRGAFSVPLIKAKSYQDHGPTVYLVSLAVRVYPGAFARTTP